MTGQGESRGALLRRFDARAADFADDCVERAGGARLARDEVETLWELAGAITEDLSGWANLVGRLDFAARAGLDPSEAAALIVECVFDPVLDAQACRVLAAAIDLVR
ncbi:MAG: hypothetical protein ACYC8V_09310 [Caulobacteraceae bacterium]